MQIEQEIKNSINRKIIGYICSYTPIEIIHAAGFHPLRIFGRDRPIQKADSLMHSNICPFVRSLLDRVLESETDFLDGVVFINSCDGMRRLYEIWRERIPKKFFHLIDLPKKNAAEDLIRGLNEVGSVVSSYVSAYL